MALEFNGWSFCLILKPPYHLPSNLMEINANHINIYRWHTVISLYDSFYKTHDVVYEEHSQTICVSIMDLAENRDG